MNGYATHNETTIETTGTARVGWIDISYDDLVNLFGEPYESNGWTEWNIETVDEDDGYTTITVYTDSQEPHNETHWRVGGYTGWANLKLHDLINELRRQKATAH